MGKPKPSIMDQVDFDLCHNVEDYNNNNNGTTTVIPPTMNPRIRKYDDYSTEEPPNLDIPFKKPKITPSMGPPSHPFEHAYTNDLSPYHHSIRTRLPAQYSIPKTTSMNMNNHNINTISRPTATATLTAATMEEHDPPPSPSSTTSTTTTSPSSPQITDGKIPMIPVSLNGLPSRTLSTAATTGSLTPSRSAVFTIYEDPDQSDPMDFDPLESDWMFPEDDKENEDRLFYEHRRVGSGNANDNQNVNEDNDGHDEDDTIEDERIRTMASEAYTQQQSERALVLEASDSLDNNRGNYYLSEDQDASADDVGFYDSLMLPWESYNGSGGGGQRLHRRHSRRGLRWEGSS